MIFRRILLAGWLAASAAQAGVTVSLDVHSLDQLLGAVAVHEVDVPIAEGQSLALQLEDFKLVGLVPQANGPDYIQTSLTVKAPQIGLVLPIEPRLSLAVVEGANGSSLLELRFEQVKMALPLGGLDLAGFLEPLQFPANSVFVVSGAQGDIEIHSKLVGIEITKDVVRFDLELQVDSAAGP